MSAQKIIGGLRDAIITQDIDRARDLLADPAHRVFLNQNFKATEFLTDLAQETTRRCLQIKTTEEKIQIIQEIKDLIWIAASHDGKYIEGIGPGRYRQIELSDDGLVTSTTRAIPGTAIGPSTVRSKVPLPLRLVPGGGFSDLGFEKRYGTPPSP